MKLKTMPTPSAPKVVISDDPTMCHPHVRYKSAAQVEADHMRWAKAKSKRRRAHESRRINARRAKR